MYLQTLITYNDINSLRPCYDPIRYISRDWKGTLLDVLEAEQVSAEDKVWVVLRFLTKRQRINFAVHCANRALQYAKIDVQITGRTYKQIKKSAEAAFNAAFAVYDPNGDYCVVDGAVDATRGVAYCAAGADDIKHAYEVACQAAAAADFKGDASDEQDKQLEDLKELLTS